MEDVEILLNQAVKILDMPQENASLIAKMIRFLETAFMIHETNPFKENTRSEDVYTNQAREIWKTLVTPEEYISIIEAVKTNLIEMEELRKAASTTIDNVEKVIETIKKNIQVNEKNIKELEAYTPEYRKKIEKEILDLNSKFEPHEEELEKLERKRKKTPEVNERILKLRAERKALELEINKLSAEIGKCQKLQENKKHLDHAKKELENYEKTKALILKHSSTEDERKKVEREMIRGITLKQADARIGMQLKRVEKAKADLQDAVRDLEKAGITYEPGLEDELKKQLDLIPSVPKLEMEELDRLDRKTVKTPEERVRIMELISKKERLQGDRAVLNIKIKRLHKVKSSMKINAEEQAELEKLKTIKNLIIKYSKVYERIESIIKFAVQEFTYNTDPISRTDDIDIQRKGTDIYIIIRVDQYFDLDSTRERIMQAFPFVTDVTAGDIEPFISIHLPAD